MIKMINFIKKFNPQTSTFQEKVRSLSDKDYIDLIFRSAKGPNVNGITFPAFPEKKLQEQTVGNSGVSAIKPIIPFYYFIKHYMFENEIILDRPNARMLDFGVGWGRIYRLFLKDFCEGNLIGSDVNPLYIDVLQKNYSDGFVYKE